MDPARHHTDNLPRVVRSADGLALRVATQDDLDRNAEARSTGRGEGRTLCCFLDADGREVFVDRPKADDKRRWPELRVRLTAAERNNT